MRCYVTEATLDERCAEWMARIAPVNRHALRLNLGASALLVVDMQRFFLDPSLPSYTCGGTAILGNVRRLIDAYRAAGRPVIFTRHVHDPSGNDAGIMGWWWKGMCVDGSPESEVHPDLAPLPGEKVVKKHRYSAFYDTDLGTVLRVLGAEDVVIAGVMTNMCCESTARDAYHRDLRVFFVADATGAMSEEMHVASLLNLAYGFAHVATTAELLGQMRE